MGTGPQQQDRSCDTPHGLESTSYCLAAGLWQKASEERFHWAIQGEAAAVAASSSIAPCFAQATQ